LNKKKFETYAIQSEFSCLLLYKKPHLNILIIHGDTKGDTGLLGLTVYKLFYKFFVEKVL